MTLFNIMCGAAGVATALSFWKWDQFVKSLFLFHADLWERLGKPIGFLWHPPTTSWWTWKGHVARQGLMMQVSFTTPAWLQNKKELLGLLHVYRFWYAVSSIIIITAIIFRLHGVEI